MTGGKTVKIIFNPANSNIGKHRQSIENVQLILILLMTKLIHKVNNGGFEYQIANKIN